MFLQFGFRMIISQFIPITDNDNSTLIKSPFHLFFIGGLIIVYFYFRSLVRGNEKLSWSDLYYFLPIFLLVIVNYIILIYYPDHNTERRALNLLTIISLHAFIIYKIITTLKNSIWNKNAIKQYANLELLKKWVLFCLSIFIIISLKFYTAVNYTDFSSSDLRNPNTTLINSLFFLIFVIIILSSPKLLYGDKRLKSVAIDPSPKSKLIHFHKLWLRKCKEITNEQDKLLNVRIGSIMESIHAKISANDFDPNLFRNPDLEIGEFAKDLGFPKSHVFFLFKYYSKISFVEFRTMVRINLAITEIDKGYLHTNTMESLAVTIGFSSYNPFFNGFKKHIGLSPKKYQVQQAKMINESFANLISEV